MRQQITDKSRGISAKRRVAAVCAGALVAAMLPASALAAENSPQAGGQIEAGSTDVYVQLANSGEVSQSDENLRFTIPSEIDFVAKANGTLVGPSTYMENGSVFSIHASALAVQANNNWHIVADATKAAESARDQVDFQVGPPTDKRNASDHLTKASMGNAAAWNMRESGASGEADRVPLTTSGHVRNVDQQITSKTKVATLTWYVTPGTAS